MKHFMATNKTGTGLPPVLPYGPQQSDPSPRWQVRVSGCRCVNRELLRRMGSLIPPHVNSPHRFLRL